MIYTHVQVLLEACNGMDDVKEALSQHFSWTFDGRDKNSKNRSEIVMYSYIYRKRIVELVYNHKMTNY